jgi:hypothetical protein
MAKIEIKTSKTATAVAADVLIKEDSDVSFHCRSLSA